MRLAIAALLFGVLVPDAHASPFGDSRSDVSDETGSSSVKLSMKKKAKKPAKKADDDVIIVDDKPAKPAKKAKKAKPAEDTIVIVEDEPARPAKKAKRKKAEAETIVIVDDEPAKKKAKPKKAAPEPEVLIIEDEPAKPAKKAKRKKAESIASDDDETTKAPTKVARVDDTDDASDDEPARLTKSASGKPRAARFYFRAGGLKSSTKLGEKQFALFTDLPVDTSNLGAGSGVELEQSQVPLGVIVGYVLPVMNRKLSVETILGFPVKTKFKATGALANESLAPTFQNMPTGIPALGSDLAEASFASPVVTGVYRITEFADRVTPIAGAGVMVLMARNAKITNSVLNEAGDPKMSIQPSPGFVLQGGAEIKVWKNVVARVDLKYVIGMRVKATVEDIAVTPTALPQLGSIPVGDAQMAAKITPFVAQVGVGADF